jgi:acyl-CoA reductase-like NAD-dependent aldehyde dehydrogenase
LPLLSPVTGKTLWNYSRASEKDAIRAVDSAAAAFPDWSLTKAQMRRDVLLRAAEVLQERREDLTSSMMDEIAATVDWAEFNIYSATEMVKEVAGRITSVSEGALPETIDSGGCFSNHWKIHSAHQK